MRLTETAQYWRNKLKNKKSIEFPSKLCDAIADITDDFSFAYLKEAFVATLLDLARSHDDDGEEEETTDKESDGEDDPLDKYEFWRAFKSQVKILRREMSDGGNSGDEDPTPDPEPRIPKLPPFSAGISGLEYEEMTPMLQNMRLQGGSQKTALPQGATGMDLGRRFASSARSPIDGFAPLARNKSEGAWEWGV